MDQNAIRLIKELEQKYVMMFIKTVLDENSKPTGYEVEFMDVWSGESTIATESNLITAINVAGLQMLGKKRGSR